MPKLSEWLKSVFFILLFLQFFPPLLKNIYSHYGKLLEPRTKVGYLPIKGIITNSGYYTHYLRKFFEASEIKAIMLYIESPGGAAGSAEAIAHEIDILKKEHHKPVITLAENMITSASYLIGCHSEWIICSPSTLVGSIGTIIPGQFKLHDFLEHYNIQYKSITSGKYKSATDPFTTMTPEQQAMLLDVTAASHTHFIEDVSNHRSRLSSNMDDLRNGPTVWGQGQIFTGIQALAIGLVDQIGSKSDAERKIKELAVIDTKIEWVKPEKAFSLSSLLSPEYHEDDESYMNAVVNYLYSTIKNQFFINY